MYHIREEIQPRVQLTFAFRNASAYSDQLDDWKVLFNVFNGPLGEEYYTSRQKILRLYGVDEAFVRHKVGLVTMVFEVHELPSGSSKETLLAVPRRVAELQVATRPPGDSVPENRTWLHFDHVHVDLEGMAAPAVVNEYVTAWIPAPIKISELSVKLSRQWTWQDGQELAQAINRGGVRIFNLLARSVREIAVAIAVRELVLDRTDEVAITAMIDDNWEVNSEAFEDAWKLLPPQLTKKPRLQLQLILPRVQETVPEHVDMLMRGLYAIDESLRAKILAFSDIQLRIRVYKIHTSDVQVVSTLLDVLGSRVTHLELDSVSDFDDDERASPPDDLNVETILRRCPELRLLAVQTASLDGLRDLFERRVTKLEALRVHWPPTASTIALVESLGDPSSQISKHLVEFRTWRYAPDLQAACLKTLNTSKWLRYLRLGSSPSNIPRSPLHK